MAGIPIIIEINEEIITVEVPPYVNIEVGAEFPPFVQQPSDWNSVINPTIILNKPTIPAEYTDAMAQDAVGSILNNSGNVDFTYTTNTSIAASVDLSGKQDALTSGVNIKTINLTSVLGSGNISVQPTLTFTPEDIANKSTSIMTDGSSDIKYPSAKAVKDYADGLISGVLSYRGAYDASSNLFPSTGGSGIAGAIEKGNLWLISIGGTLGGTPVFVGDSIVSNIDTPGQTPANWDILSGNISYVPEDEANKVTSISGASTNVQYPSAKLLFDQLVLKQSGDATLTALAALDSTAGLIRQTSADVFVKDTSVYLNVDQTTPQTIINGRPVFNAGIQINNYVKIKGIRLTPNIKTSTYTVDVDDYLIICNSVTPFSIILLPATGTGQSYKIKNINTGAVTIQPDTTGTPDTIDGQSTQIITQWDSIDISDFIIDKWIIT